MKFGLRIDVDLRKRKKVTSLNTKPEVVLSRRGCHLENRYSIISAEDGPIWTKFGSLMHIDMPSMVTWSKSKPEVEFQYGGLLIFQTGSSYISAMDWNMSTNFDLLIDVDLRKRKRVTSSNTKREVVLRRRGCHLENRSSVISAEDGPIWTKFDWLMHSDMPSMVIWSKSKPEVEFQYDERLFFFQTGSIYISTVD